VTNLVIEPPELRSTTKANGNSKARQGEIEHLAKLHLVVAAASHVIIAAEISLDTVADNEVLRTLLKLGE